ncbi:hypothetical protein L228DRAFT_249007 [Xylona heveae TC161]|uniref:Aminoglycoside phosphotransferase domain-containing protein n=1 Tax=Xylona heveae (strain CBS 132557 / TC161) TaxID=1328760 RepID=A0A165FPA4_XYLHT|nr:hypothetical protein L228DRAFT_249007 [Xylona heveae TC161]KZF21221.1 hypothetical protein L228DRAFT_249007 [Xylona heveae TC161]
MSSPLNPEHTSLIRTILKDKFDLEDFTVHKIERAKNNHVYRIDLNRPFSEAAPSSGIINHFLHHSVLKPYSSQIPVGTSKLLLRISKRDVSLENSVRIANEVAFLALARDALSHMALFSTLSNDSLPYNSIIPRVYAWEQYKDDGSDLDSVSGLTTRATPGWILEEYMAGTNLTPKDISGLDQETQTLVLRQMAQVIKSLQDYTLPETVGGYGGLGFDYVANLQPNQQESISGAARIVNTLMVIPCGGPFSTYPDLCKAMCTWQLHASDQSAHLNRWKDYRQPNGRLLRERLDAFFTSATGLNHVLAKISESGEFETENRPTLIHGDFAFPNLLFDPSTYRLTAVMDFDFAHIGSPISEWLFSFWDIPGLLPGSAEPLGRLRDWLLSGFPSEDGHGSDKANDDDGNASKKGTAHPEAKSNDPPNFQSNKWNLPRAWDAALRHVGVTHRPSTIRAAGDIADLWWFSQELCQAYYFMESFIQKKSSEQLEKMKEHSATTLDKYLVQWGF